MGSNSAGSGSTPSQSDAAAKPAGEGNSVEKTEALPLQPGDQGKGLQTEMGLVPRRLGDALAFDLDECALGLAHLELIPELQRHPGAVESGA
jgi:hypothetical protein